MTKVTKRNLIAFARLYAEERGLINVSRADVCSAVGIPVGSFQHVARCTWKQFVKELSTTKQPKRVRYLRKARNDPALMRARIIDVALRLAERGGYDKITRADIADAAGISASLVTHHFGSMDRLRFQLMQCAVKEKRTKIIAQGLVGGSPTAKRASLKLRRRAAKLLSGV